MTVTAWTEITARIQFAGAQILAGHPEGMRGRELWPLVEARFPNLDQEWKQASTGSTGPEKIFQWYSVGLVKCGWLTKAGGRWYLTPLGRTALVKRYLEGCRLLHAAAEPVTATGSRNKAGFEMAKRLAEAVPEGSWVAAG